MVTDSRLRLKRLQIPDYRNPAKHFGAVRSPLELASQVAAGNVEHVVPAASPVVAARNVVNVPGGTDVGARAVPAVVLIQLVDGEDSTAHRRRDIRI